MLTPEQLAEISKICRRPVAVASQIHLITRELKGDAKKLAELVERSHKKLSVIYPFLKLVERDGASTLTVFLTDMVREADGRPVLERYELNAEECSVLANMNIEAVTLVEQSDVRAAGEHIEVEPFVSTLLNGHAFVHVDEDWLAFMENSALMEGNRVEWAAFAIGHQSGGLHMRAGIHLVLHWYGHSPHVRFHLATGDAVEALTQYTNQHATNENMRQISSGPGFDRIDGRVLSKLIDHPLFNYYLKGESPKLR